MYSAIPRISEEFQNTNISLVTKIKGKPWGDNDGKNVLPQDELFIVRGLLKKSKHACHNEVKKMNFSCLIPEKRWTKHQSCKRSYEIRSRE